MPCAEAFIKAHASGWRNAKHGDQWRKTLTSYAFPVIGEFPVSTIDTTHVLKVLEPIWTSKTETAKRLRGRIENGWIGPSLGGFAARRTRHVGAVT